MREEILLEWNPWWEGDFDIDYVERDVQDKIKKWMERPDIVALTGARRSGKTTLMYITISDFLGEVSPEQILFVKCDDERVEEPIIDEAIEKHVELFNPDGKTFLFLDEVQGTDNWNQTVKRIYDLGDDVKIVLSGSRLLREEISSSLAGRCAYFGVYPFSFEEFLRAKGVEVGSKLDKVRKKGEIKHHLREYLEWGGFPEITLEEDEGMRRELLEFYSDTILYRDVIERSNIQKVDKIEKLKAFLMSNVSNLVSYNKTANRLGISQDSVSSYVREMENAYYFFTVPRFSFSVKKQQVNPKKIYCIDTGLRNYVGFRFSEDVGRLYENTVFMHLKRNGKEAYYWKDDKNRETDFLVKDGTEIESALQVCYDVKEAGDREIESLVSALEEFDLKEGTIITSDREGEDEIEGKTVRYIPLWKWLLE